MKKLYLLAAAALCAATATAANGDVTDGWLMLEDFEGTAPEMTAFDKNDGNAIPTGTIEVATMDKDGNASNHALQFTPAGGYSHGIQIKATLPEGKTIADYTDIRFDICGVNTDYKPLHLFINGTKITEGGSNVVGSTGKWYTCSYSISVSGSGNEITVGFYNHTSNSETIAFDNICLKEKSGGTGEDPDPIQPGESLNGTVTDGWLMGEDFEVATEAPALFDYYGDTPGGTATIETQANDKNTANKVAKFTGGNWNSGLSVSIKLPEGKTLADYDALDFDMYNYDMENKSIFVYIDMQAIREPAGDNDQGNKNSWKHFFYEIETTGNTATEIAVNIGFKINSNSFAIDNIRLREREPELEVVGTPAITIKHGTAAGTITVSYSFDLKNYNGEEIKVVASVDGHEEVLFDEYVPETANVQTLAADENTTFSGNLKAQHDVLKTISNPNVSLTATAGEKQLFAITKAPDTTTGIEDVTVDSEAPVEYFNLQGLRVAQPEAGQLYIKRQGDKAVKVRF